MRQYTLILLVITLFSCNTPSSETGMAHVDFAEELTLSQEQASRIASLPLGCIQKEFPYKPGLVIATEGDLQFPKVHHPAFYGCFDWHSAVHGHWVLVYLLKRFPDLPEADQIRQALNTNLTKENIETEIDYFTLNKGTGSFERTYGWAWILKLVEELQGWEDLDGQNWKANLDPLAELLIEKYKSYLPKLTYPIRVGEHTNTAFGLTFAWDYAKAHGQADLMNLISQRANDFYLNDKGCPIDWEPSGYDFLSPCLEEAEIMQRVLPKKEFLPWLESFLPTLRTDQTAPLKPAQVSDRSDGKLVHLDGLNFSRAWCLYRIAKDTPQLGHYRQWGDEHLSFSLDNIIDGEYAGEHWLGTFALYALSQREGK